MVIQRAIHTTYNLYISKIGSYKCNCKSINLNHQWDKIDKGTFGLVRQHFIPCGWLIKYKNHKVTGKGKNKIKFMF